MAKYYGLMTGLPELHLESPKPPITLEELYEELRATLSKADRKLLEQIRLEAINGELARLISEGRLTPPDTSDSEVLEYDSFALTDEEEHLTTLPLQDLKYLAYMASIGRPERRHSLLPYHIVTLIRELYTPNDEEQETHLKLDEHDVLAVEHRLTGLYYMSNTRSDNAFIADWFRFNQTLRNVLVVFSCRRLGWSPAPYIVGSGEIEQRLRTSNARDFDLGDEFPQIHAVLAIAEETDITRRERMIDALRWHWLEEYNFAKVFDIDNVLGYYIQTSIIERWTRLDEEIGERKFRELVAGLKRESNASLQEFRNNTSKH